MDPPSRSPATFSEKLFSGSMSCKAIELIEAEPECHFDGYEDTPQPEKTFGPAEKEINSGQFGSLPTGSLPTTCSTIAPSTMASPSSEVGSVPKPLAGASTIVPIPSGEDENQEAAQSRQGRAADVSWRALLLPALCFLAVVVPVIWDATSSTWSLTWAYHDGESLPTQALLGFTFSALLSFFPFSSFIDWTLWMLHHERWRVAVVSLICGRVVGLTFIFLVVRAAQRLKGDRPLPFLEKVSLPSKIEGLKASTFGLRVSTFVSSMRDVVQDWPLLFVACWDFSFWLSSLLVLVLAIVCPKLRWYKMGWGFFWSNFRLTWYLFVAWLMFNDGSRFPFLDCLFLVNFLICSIVLIVLTSASLRRCARRLVENADEQCREAVRAREQSTRVRLCGSISCITFVLFVVAALTTMKSLQLLKKGSVEKVGEWQCLDATNTEQNLTLKSFSMIIEYQVSIKMPVTDLELEMNGTIYNADTQQHVGSMLLPRTSLNTPPSSIRPKGGAAVTNLNITIELDLFDALGWNSCYLPDGRVCPTDDESAPPEDPDGADGDEASTSFVDNSPCVPANDVSYIQCLQERCQDADLIHFGASVPCSIVVNMMGCDFTIPEDGTINNPALQGQPVSMLCVGSCSPSCRRLADQPGSSPPRSLQGFQALDIVLEIASTTTGNLDIFSQPLYQLVINREKAMRQHLDLGGGAGGTGNLLGQVFSSSTMGDIRVCKVKEVSDEPTQSHCAESVDRLWNSTEMLDDDAVWECDRIDLDGGGGSIWSHAVYFLFLCTIILLLLCCQRFGCYHTCCDHSDVEQQDAENGLSADSVHRFYFGDSQN